MSQEFTELIKQAQSAIDAKNNELALSHIASALAKNPTSAQTYFLRAQVNEKQNELKKAYADYTQAIEYCPEDYRLYKARAELAQKLDKAITPDKIKSLVYAALNDIDFDLFEQARLKLEEAQKLDVESDVVNCGFAIWSARAKNLEVMKTYQAKLPNLAEADALAYVAHAYLKYYNQAFAQMLDNVELALEKDPYFARAHVLKSILFQLTEKLDKAIEAVTKALEIYPEFAWAYDVRSSFYQLLNQKDEARQDADTLLQLDTDNYAYWHRRAVLRYGQSNLQGAIADCEEALKRQPDYSPTYATRGMSLVRQSIQENGTQALEDLNKAVELAPSLAENYYHRAEIHTQLGRNQSAIADYERFMVLRRSQQAETGYITRNLLQFDMSNIEEKVQQAIEQLRTTPVDPAPVSNALDFKEVTTPKPPSAEDFLKHGEAYMEEGKHEFAEEAFAHALDLDPENARAYANLAVINWMNNDFDRAFLCVQEALKLDPSLPLGHLQARLLASQPELHAEAIKAYTTLIKAEPAIATYYLERGNLYLENAQYPESLADLSRALEINYLLEEAYFMRGTVYGKLEDFAEALADMQQVLEINPHHGEAYFFIGYILLRMGEKERCVQSVEKALELEPYHPNAEIWRQKLAIWQK